MDVPGYLPGTQQEYGGVIRHGAKVLFAYSEANVPKIALIVRKSYGGAYIAMCGFGLGYDRVLAYPFAEIAVMGPEGAANIIFRREISEADDPEKVRQEKIEEYRKPFRQTLCGRETRARGRRHRAAPHEGRAHPRPGDDRPQTRGQAAEKTRKHSALRIRISLWIHSCPEFLLTIIGMGVVFGSLIVLMMVILLLEKFVGSGRLRKPTRAWRM